MNKVIGAALVCLMGVIGANAATASTAQCVNCSNAQMYNMARTLGASSSPHLVWDPATGSVGRYRNYCGTLNSVDQVKQSRDPDNRSGATTATGCNLQTEELPVDGETSNMAVALSQVWHATGGTMKGNLTVNITSVSFPQFLPGLPTAHDFLYDVQFRGEILRMASEPGIFSMGSNPLSGPLSYIAGHLDSFFGFTSGIVLTIDIVFADGSSIKLLVKLNEQASYVANSAMDSSGHTLPEPNFGTPAYPGTWYYPPGTETDMSEFLLYMEQLGVVITNGSGTPGVITCRWIQSENHTQCFVPH